MECEAYRDLRVGIDPEIVVKLLHHLPQVGHPVLHGGGQDGLLGEGNEEERQIREVFRRHVTVLAPGVNHAPSALVAGGRGAILLPRPMGWPSRASVTK